MRMDAPSEDVESCKDLFSDSKYSKHRLLPLSVVESSNSNVNEFAEILNTVQGP